MTTDAMPVRAGAWMLDGVCAAMGPHAWESLEPGQQRAKCVPCPVASKCLSYGISIEATEVVFGGHQFPLRPYRKPVAK